MIYLTLTKFLAGFLVLSKIIFIEITLIDFYLKFYLKKK